jgi:hypothetical protein
LIWAQSRLWVFDSKRRAIGIFFRNFVTRTQFTGNYPVWRIRALPHGQKFPASPLEELQPISSTAFCSGEVRSMNFSQAKTHIRACPGLRNATVP